MTLTDRIWHWLYCRWYDHQHAGHVWRAALYGRAADAWCQVVWP